MEVRKLPAGVRVQYHLEDGIPHEGTVAKTVTGIGYAVITLAGTRKLIPAQNVRVSLR